MDPNVFLERRQDATAAPITAPDLARLTKVLDEIGHEGRLWTVRRWGGSQMSLLFEAAKGHHALDLDHFVPSGTEPLVEVIHDGHNSLPMFQHFEKRFCKPTALADGGPVLFAFNEGPTRPAVGPGYFVAGPGESGEIVFDYRRTPNEKPPSWPAFAPNRGLIAGPVFGDLVDVVRGLSSHVVIGRGFRREQPLDNWFVLVRRDSTGS